MAEEDQLQTKGKLTVVSNLLVALLGGENTPEVSIWIAIMTGVRKMLPVENPTDSYWLSEPHHLANYCSSEKVPEDVDIAIIGTGLSGVATAYHILKNSEGPRIPKVVLFEARQACSGATGRNGGHNKFPVPSLKNISDNYGEEVASELFDWVAAQRRGLKATAEAEGVDCAMLLTRSYDMYFDKAHAETMKTWLLGQQRKGAAWTSEIQWLEGPNLDRITGTKGAFGATSGPALSFWPYKLVMRLLERVVELGGGLYTETPVQRIDSSDPGFVNLFTSKGITKATKVVYATNGYSAGLLPQFLNVIMPVKGQACRLVPNEQTHHGFHPTTTYNLFYGDFMADYLNPRPDGTIVLGGGIKGYRKNPADRNEKWWNTVDDSDLLDPAVKDGFDKVMETYFRGWEKSEARVSITWTGIMGSTRDSAPHVGLIPGTTNQWLLAGFNGGGMALIFTLTKSIAGMVLHGDAFEETDIPKRFKTTQERISKMKF